MFLVGELVDLPRLAETIEKIEVPCVAVVDEIRLAAVGAIVIRLKMEIFTFAEDAARKRFDALDDVGLGLNGAGPGVSVGEAVRRLIIPEVFRPIALRGNPVEEDLRGRGANAG